MYQNSTKNGMDTIPYVSRFFYLLERFYHSSTIDCQTIPLTIKDIQKNTKLSYKNTKKIIKKLVEKGFIFRSKTKITCVDEEEIINKTFIGYFLTSKIEKLVQFHLFIKDYQNEVKRLNLKHNFKDSSDLSKIAESYPFCFM